MNRSLTATVLSLPVAAVLLAACSSSSSATASPVAAPAVSRPAVSATTAGQAVSPVTILRKTGATVPAGTVVGDHDADGDRYASGTFKDGEMITVYTSATMAAFWQSEDQLTPDDNHGEVTIPGQLAVITTTGIMGGSWGGPTPAQIAIRVGGLVITPDN